MALGRVVLIGGPAPFQEALTARLESASFVVGAEDVEPAALVVYCDSTDRWATAADAALWTPTVVVVSELEIDQYVRALALGAGVVHMDTPTEVMVDVVEAAIAGEALLPLAITKSLASHVPPGRTQVVSSSLEGIEIAVAEGLVSGRTIYQIADQLSYSERTIRRKLQGIYLKLGVENKSAALEMLTARPDRLRPF